MHNNFHEWNHRHTKRTNESDIPSAERGKKGANGYGCDFYDVVDRAYHNYTTSWGPVGFKKEHHPLAIMVNLTSLIIVVIKVEIK